MAVRLHVMQPSGEIRQRLDAQMHWAAVDDPRASRETTPFAVDIAQCVNPVSSLCGHEAPVCERKEAVTGERYLAAGSPKSLMPSRLSDGLSGSF